MSYTAGPAQHPCPPPAGPVQAPQAPNTASPRAPLPSDPLSCTGPLGQLPNLSLDPVGTRPLFSLSPTQPWARASPQGAPRALPSAPHTSQCGDVVMCEAVLPWLPAVLQAPGRRCPTTASWGPSAAPSPDHCTSPQHLLASCLCHAGTSAPHNHHSLHVPSPHPLNHSPLPKTATQGLSTEQAGVHRVGGRGWHTGQSQAVGTVGLGITGSHLHSADCQHCRCRS